MFKCGSGLSDEDRRNPPKIGTKITFGYFELSDSSVPRFPTFKRVFQGRV
jgi:DNA ligase-1